MARKKVKTRKQLRREARQAAAEKDAKKTRFKAKGIDLDCQVVRTDDRSALHPVDAEGNINRFITIRRAT